MKSSKNNPFYSRTNTDAVNASEEEWKQALSSDIHRIAREKGTERPWSSQFENHKEAGIYFCAACGNSLFKSDTKLEGGCGWPSFNEPVSKSAVIYTPDHTQVMKRTEVQCGRCKAHLGHVFDDGPPPSNLRYCINGVVLDFEKTQETEERYDNKE